VLNTTSLQFDRPIPEATEPPELRGSFRDAVRLLVSTPAGHHHSHFANLVNFLREGDLLVVNRSATFRASLPASGRRVGNFVLNLSSHYSSHDSGAAAESVWLAEPRWGYDVPGPLPLEPGDTFSVAGLRATFLHRYPALPRLAFIRFEGDVLAAAQAQGTPIRYGYMRAAFGLEHYQSIFSEVPGSAEMPSAARPFTARVLKILTLRGIAHAAITLHTGVSSLGKADTLYPEPFSVPAETVAAIYQARAAGGRVVAVGTTVVRALESAFYEGRLHATEGFTRLYLRSGRTVNVVDGLITGFHAPEASHLEMLYAVAGETLVRDAYTEALAAGYLWHEFGDSHLILPERPPT